MIGLYSLVQTNVDKNGIHHGTYGTVIETISPIDADVQEYLVELLNEYGYPFDENIYEENELRILTKREVDEYEKRRNIDKMIKERGW